MEQFIITNQSWLVPLVALWTLPWKGVALWKASKQNDQKWFIALLVINAMGILEILYIYYFSKRTNKTA